MDLHYLDSCCRIIVNERQAKTSELQAWRGHIPPFVLVYAQKVGSLEV